MKKVFVCLFTFVLAAGLIAGCGNTQSVNTPVTEAPPTVTLTELEPPEIDNISEPETMPAATPAESEPPKIDNTPEPKVLPAATPIEAEPQESLVFSTPQIYEGSIPFENSKDVKIKFHLSANGAEINKIEFDMKELSLKPENSDSSVSGVTFNDAGLVVTTIYTVRDGKISSDKLIVFDLNVTQACIYGMFSFVYDQNGENMVSNSVYAVIPNITTPKEIPQNLLNR